MELELQGGDGPSAPGVEEELQEWRRSFRVEEELQGGAVALGWSYSFRVELQLQAGGGASGWRWSFRVEL